MNEGTTMYRGHFNFGSLSEWHPETEASAFCSTMSLSPCGQYVQVQRRRLDGMGWDTTRESISDYWQPTRTQALAVLAPRLRQIGERLIRQANELEQAAQDESRDRPALAAAADASQPHGSPTGSGE
jgi:hypothetical protein